MIGYQLSVFARQESQIVLIIIIISATITATPVVSVTSKLLHCKFDSHLFSLLNSVYFPFPLFTRIVSLKSYSFLDLLFRVI